EPSMGVPTGNVLLLDGNTVIASGPLRDGVAVFRITNLFIGSHTITARYEGSVGFEGSTSGEVPVLVGTVNQRWVAPPLRDLPRRTVAPGSLATFTALLDGGLSHYNAALRIMFECSGAPVRCEFFELTVRDLYRALLRRDADPGGLEGHVQYLRQGGTIG